MAYTTLIPTLIAGIVVIAALILGEDEVPPETDENFSCRITTLYDNRLYGEDLESGHGFSCMVELEGETVLFDTGETSQSLLSNMERLGFSAEDVDTVFLSHRHWDHVGGLEGLLKENSAVRVVMPSTFPDTVRKMVENRDAETVNIDDSHDFGSFLSTGAVGGVPDEQAMVVPTEEGLMVLLGCSHPGVVKMVEKALEISGEEEIAVVAGGFHLGGTSEQKINDIISKLKDLGVKRVSPTHCTGTRAIKAFREEFGENFIENGVGRELVLK